MIDRTRPPELKSIKSAHLPDYHSHLYDNGIQLIVVNSGVHEVFKLEVIFNAGRLHEDKKMVASLTQRMLREGTKDYNSDELSEMVDFYGASLGTPSSLDYSSITLYGINQHFKSLFPILKSVVLHPTFPQKEFKDSIADRKQKLQVDLSKNNVLSYRTITEEMYGKDHPYGYNSSIELYDDINIEDLKNHHQNHFVAGNCTIVLSGKVHDDMVKQLEQELLSYIPLGNSNASYPKEKFIGNKNLFLEKPQSVQTAIKLGFPLITRQHPDFYGLYFLNVIFGDYFSSRLMANIREDKGYTYHIYSMLDVMKNDGILLISTETAHEYVDNTLKEIHFEIERLQNDLVPIEEIQMARNYTLGNMLSAMDGPFNAAGVIKGLFLNNLDKNFFNNLIYHLNHIDANELRTLAQKYFVKENMYQVLAGKK